MINQILRAMIMGESQKTPVRVDSDIVVMILKFPTPFTMPV